MLAAALGLLIGIVVGGFGGGGGVLAVPALVYLLGQGAADATTGSVVIVGVTAAFGVLVRIRGGRVRWRTGFATAAAGAPAAAAGSLLSQRVAEPVLLVSFAALTMLAAAALLLDPHDDAPEPAPSGTGGVAVAAPPVALVARIVGCGLVVGFLTGFLGVGGGFLMVPALVLVLRMPMTEAVGTSLLVILVNSGAAFATRAGVAELDWALLLPFTAAAVAGSLVGKRVCERLSGRTLTRAFAVLLLAVGVFVAVEGLLGS